MSNYYAQMPQGQYYPEGQGQPGPQPPMGYPPQGGMPQGMPMGQPYPAQPYPPQPTQVIVQAPPEKDSGTGCLACCAGTLACCCCMDMLC